MFFFSKAQLYKIKQCNYKLQCIHSKWLFEIICSSNFTQIISIEQFIPPVWVTTRTLTATTTGISVLRKANVWNHTRTLFSDLLQHGAVVGSPQRGSLCWSGKMSATWKKTWWESYPWWIYEVVSEDWGVLEPDIWVHVLWGSWHRLICQSWRSLHERGVLQAWWVWEDAWRSVEEVWSSWNLLPWWLE